MAVSSVVEGAVEVPSVVGGEVVRASGVSVTATGAVAGSAWSAIDANGAVRRWL